MMKTDVYDTKSADLEKSNRHREVEDERQHFRVDYVDLVG